MRSKKAQQEMVGFVLIVVLVMIGLMVFLIMSVRDSGEVSQSVKVENMLDVLMKTTTECAIVYEPDYDDVEDLMKSCYKGSSCSNLGKSACEYLNETVLDMVNSMIDSDATVDAWKIDFYVRDGEGLIQWSGGNCSSSVNGAQRTIASGGSSLVVWMRIFSCLD